MELHARVLEMEAKVKHLEEDKVWWEWWYKNWVQWMQNTVRRLSSAMAIISSAWVGQRQLPRGDDQA